MNRFRRRPKTPPPLDLPKSIWKERAGQTFAFFCPYCSVPRHLGMDPRPGRPRHFAQVGLTAAMVMLGTWSWFGWKGIVSFVPLWMAFEVYYRTRVRAALRCDGCGFDPTLYLVDAARAKQSIRDHWEEKNPGRREAIKDAESEAENEELHEDDLTQ